LRTSTRKDHYEAHITVINADIDAFRQACGDLALKAILIDGMVNGGGVFKDLMTSSKFLGAFDDALAYITDKATALRDLGFDVVRTKLETTPMNALTPSYVNGMLAKTGPGYFESHVPVHVTADRLGDLRNLARTRGAHMSRNAFKVDGDTQVMMLTLRSHHDLYETFLDRVNGLKQRLADALFETSPVIVEYAIHDTNVHHDREWTGQSVDR
jgi:hypothetical protein